MFPRSEPRTTQSALPNPADLPRVFLDADAIVAGSASTTGAAHLILQLGEVGVIDVVSSGQAREEVERVLRRKLPAALPAFTLLADAAVRWIANPPQGNLNRYSGWADPKDLPILVAAIEEGCASLVTFNKRHFKPEKGSIRVENPGEFIERLRSILEKLAE